MAQSCTHEAQKEDKLNDEGANTPPPSAQICWLVILAKHCTVVYTHQNHLLVLHGSLFWDALGRIWARKPTSTEVHRPKCKEEEPHLRSAREISLLHRVLSGKKGWRDALWSHTTWSWPLGIWLLAGTLWCVMASILDRNQNLQKDLGSPWSGGSNLQIQNLSHLVALASVVAKGLQWLGLVTRWQKKNKT